MRATTARRGTVPAVAITAVLLGGVTAGANAATGAAPATVAAPAAGGSATAANNHCTPVPLSSTRYVGANGHPVSSRALATESATTATVKTYRMPDGTTMSTTMPPASFRPQAAAMTTARSYGFDAPSKPAALKTWRARYAGYRRTIESVPCVRDDGLRWATTYGSLWSGNVATGHTYNEVYDDQNIPTYSTTCGANSGSLVGHWIGLGGYKSGRLIQQGFNPPSASTNGAQLWYEYLNDSHLNPPVYIGNDTHTGNVISEYTTYSGGTAAFHWYDRTAGTQWSPVTITGVSSYYDGSTAEFISERPSGYKLRKFTTEKFSAAGASYGTTFVDLGSLPHDNTILTTNGTSSGAQLITNGALGASSYSQTWNRCS